MLQVQTPDNYVYGKQAWVYKEAVWGKIGYDQSLITAITRHFNEAVKYDKGLGMEVPQKSRKQPIMGDYYTYNGERDNVDYDWEKNESIIRSAIIESIKKVLGEEVL